MKHSLKNGQSVSKGKISPFLLSSEEKGCCIFLSSSLYSFHLISFSFTFNLSAFSIETKVRILFDIIYSHSLSTQFFDLFQKTIGKAKEREGKMRRKTNINKIGIPYNMNRANFVLLVCNIIAPREFKTHIETKARRNDICPWYFAYKQNQTQ